MQIFSGARWPLQRGWSVEEIAQKLLEGGESRRSACSHGEGYALVTAQNGAPAAENDGRGAGVIGDNLNSRPVKECLTGDTWASHNPLIEPPTDCAVQVSEMDSSCAALPLTSKALLSFPPGRSAPASASFCGASRTSAGRSSSKNAERPRQSCLPPAQPRCARCNARRFDPAGAGSPTGDRDLSCPSEGG